MLVLERELNEVITIGDEIEVTVVKTGKNKVRLGITAPLKYHIDRKEVKDAKAAGSVTPRRRLDLEA